MARRVLLPHEIGIRLHRATNAIEEINGVLFYRAKGSDCPIESFFLTGVGNPGHVASKPERIEVVNEFLRRNPAYRFVKPHTHSVETIRQFGLYYVDHFFKGDFESYEDQLKHNPEFIGMLVTPRKMLLYGADNPRLEIVRDSQTYRLNNGVIHQELKDIAREMGHNLGTLTARMKR